MVGTYVDSTGRIHGFTDSRSTFTTIDVPGASNTFVNGVNDHGQIVRGHHRITRRHLAAGGLRLAGARRVSGS